MSEKCPQCGRDGTWNGVSGVITNDVQQVQDRYRDSLNHQWAVTR